MDPVYDVVPKLRTYMGADSVQQIFEMITQVEQATLDYEECRSNLSRLLVDALPPAGSDLSPDAAKLCRFGSWYSAIVDSNFSEYPNFVELGRVHAHTHEEAKELLQRMAANLQIAEYRTKGLVDPNNFTHTLLEWLRIDLISTIKDRDPLTGARFRQNLIADLRVQWALVQREFQNCSVVIVNIDNFAVLNYTHNHGVGDVILKSFTEFIHSRLMPCDHLYRLVGDEFLICMPEANVAIARHAAERLCNAIASWETQVGANETTVKVTASLGVAGIDASPTAEEAIRRADESMHLAKVAGGNRVALWEVGQ